MSRLTAPALPHTMRQLWQRICFLRKIQTRKFTFTSLTANAIQSGTVILLWSQTKWLKTVLLIWHFIMQKKILYAGCASAVICLHWKNCATFFIFRIFLSALKVLTLPISAENFRLRALSVFTTAIRTRKITAISA